MSKAFYITSVSNGLVLSDQPSGKPSGVVVENKGDSDREKWLVEAGDEPNVVALKSTSNGQYLHANGGTNWSTVGTGAKQWWKISSDNVTAPGACRLSPVQYSNVFLNHFQGKPAKQGKDQIKVHMWQWENSREYWFSWYFLDTSVTFNPLVSGISETGKSNVDDEAKLKALEDRENALTQKEANRSAEWDEKMNALKEREASSAQDEEKRTSSYDQKLKDLQDREAALAKREEELKSSGSGSGKDSTPGDEDAQAKRESDIQQKLDDLSSAEQKLASDRAALEKSKSDVAAREKELRQRQKDFEDQKASAGQNGSEGPSKSALEKKQQDNAALEQRLARLEDRLAQMKKSPDVAPEKSQANGKLNGKTNGSDVGDTQSSGCGFKHYKPPRKLNRRVIGIVYQ